MRYHLFIGTHYWYDVSITMQCIDSLPFFTLYNCDGHLNAFGITPNEYGGNTGFRLETASSQYMKVRLKREIFWIIFIPSPILTFRSFLPVFTLKTIKKSYLPLFLPFPKFHQFSPPPPSSPGERAVGQYIYRCKIVLTVVQRTNDFS